MAFCVDSFSLGGTELNAVRTAEALDSQIFELFVIYFRADGPLLDRYRSIGAQLVHFPIGSFSSVSTWIRCFALAWLLRSKRIQILHAHDVYSNIFGVTAAGLSMSCKAIASRRWWYEVPRSELNFLNRISYRIADRVLANCDSVARLLVKNEHVPVRKIVEVVNFVDDASFNQVSAEEVSAKRNDWGIPVASTVVGIVARLVAVKNHQMLLRAIAQLPENIIAVCAGDGPLRSDLEALAKQLGIQHRVRFLGELRLAGNLHAYFDISVLCSDSEGFPNSVIEAMAVAKPIVATRVGGVADALDDGISGVLIPPGDVDALAQGLRFLASNHEARVAMGERAQQVALSRFRRQDVIGTISRIYTQLAKG